MKRSAGVVSKLALPLAVMLATLLLAACARGTASSGPLVTIASPVEGATIPTGQMVEIQSVASDNTTPIRRVEMYINGDLIADDSTPNPEGESSFTVTQRWVPIAPGQARVEVYAYNMENERSQAATLTLNVEGPPLAPAEPPAEEGPTEEAPVATEPTPEPTVPVEEPTPAPPPGIEGTVNADIGLNVRSGPSAESERIGGVNVNETVTGIARNGAGDWVRIRYGDGQEGWVAAQFVTWQGDIQTLPAE